MPFTTITKPSVGDPTKKQAFADIVVDDLIFLYNLMLSIAGSREVITNGSFESDADANSIPDGWTFTMFTGGTFSYETSTALADGKAAHGKRAVKFTSPGGVGKGGYTAETTDFFEITEGRIYWATWQSKSTVAGIHNVVEVQFYDSTQTSISTTTIYDSTTNPTSWALHESRFNPPANARYAKFRLIGAKDDNTTAGSVSFDDVRLITEPFKREARFDTATAALQYWKPPTGVTFAEFVVIGGGGGGSAGGGGANQGGGGGGGGGYVRAFLATTPGTRYNVTVGAGGAGSGAGSGAAGGNSTITIGATTLTGSGGAGGTLAGGVGGAGGAATGGTENIAGEAGETRPGTAVGGVGGVARFYDSAAIGGIGGVAAETSKAAGGGGGGGSQATGPGGNGAPGMVLIRY